MLTEAFTGSVIWSYFTDKCVYRYPNDNESSALTVKILADSTVELSDFIRNGEELPGKLLKGQLRDTIMTPLEK